MNIEAPRWKATVYYRTDNGIADVEHFLEELYELHDVIEAGPHWETIEKIEVVFNKAMEGPLTVEEAKQL